MQLALNSKVRGTPAGIDSQGSTCAHTPAAAIKKSEALSPCSMSHDWHPMIVGESESEIVQPLWLADRMLDCAYMCLNISCSSCELELVTQGKSVFAYIPIAKS